MRDVREHEAVMVSEVINNLIVDPNGNYLDCTFGLGGHTRAILENLSSIGTLLAIDRDPLSIQEASKILKKDSRFDFKTSSFSSIGEIEQVNKLNGIIADLGISSYQLDERERGFSFNGDFSLDMRMPCFPINCFTTII